MTRHHVALAAALLLTTAAGCAQQQEYTLPGDICGVEVDATLLKPLLPPGESLTQHTTLDGTELTGCAMEVDRKRELTFQASLVTADVNPLEVKRRELQRAGNPQKAAVGTDARIADGAAMAYSACTFGGKPHRYVVEVWADRSPSDVSARRTALTRFITAYLPAAQQKAGCTDGRPQ